jgi:hypothetical protein
MEAEGLLPYSQEPVTGSCPKRSLRYILILSSLLRLGLQSGLFDSGILTKIL